MFNTDAVLEYCEHYGIYQLYKEEGDVITYYRWYCDGLYKVVTDCKARKELERKRLRYKKTPEHLKGKVII